MNETRIQFIRTVESFGYPREFAYEMIRCLKTDKAIERMRRYLILAKPKSMEIIVDEMIAIVEEHERFRKKKVAEYNNAQYNVLLNRGLYYDDETDDQ